MIVKRYVVETMIEAMQKIRADLGSDAVILSTKETKVGGLFGLFGKKKLEVVAALETDKKETEPARTDIAAAAPLPVPAAIPRSAGAGAYRRASAAANPQQTEAETVKNVLGTGQTINSMPFASDLNQSHIKPEAQSSDNLTSGSVPTAASPGNDLPFQGNSNPVLQSEQQRQLERSIREHQGGRVQGKEDHLYEELHQMRLMIDKLARSKAEAEPLPENLERLLERLREQNIQENLIQEWLETVREGEAGSFTDSSADALSEKIRRFAAEREGGGIGEQTRIVYVAGPTGVGKTTTIAKLAAEQMFKRKRKVGFITSDTYRISAVEQLRTYASILNVPLEVVQSPGDLQRAFQKLEDCDLILMDTAGRNFRNELLVSELQALIAPVEQSETYLVLSLTSKYTDMAEITDNFIQYRLDKVIFTKADETGSFGSIFSLLYRYPLKYSYITNGQNVPDDLLLPSGDLLVDVLLGEQRI